MTLLPGIGLDKSNCLLVVHIKNSLLGDTTPPAALMDEDLIVLVVFGGFEPPSQLLSRVSSEPPPIQERSMRPPY